MRLVITEKPSVAKSISDVLGAIKKREGYFEGNRYLVSWCVGHLIELAPPESYGMQWRKWTKFTNYSKRVELPSKTTDEKAV